MPFTIRKPANSQWTDEQWSAISLHGQDLLVAAAAGSGKTAVLVERIIRRITAEEDPIDVDRLLVATFTNAAAAEMRQRIREALEQELFRHPDSQHLRRQLALMNKTSITTLHSFCLEVIQRYFQVIGIDPKFRIASETEAELLRNDVLEQLMEEVYGSSPEESDFWRLVDWFGGERGDEALSRLVLRLYDFSRSHPWPEHWLKRTAQSFESAGADSGGDSDVWLQSLAADVQLELRGALGLLREAAKLAALPSGPAPYAETLRDDAAYVEHLLDITQNRSWEHAYHAFQSSGFGKLKPCRGEHIDKELQERVKSLREQAKKQIGAIRDELFQRPPSDFFAEMREMAPMMQELVELVLAFGERYGAEKAAKGLVDFADLEHFCLQALRSPDSTPDCLMPSPAALDYRERFVEVLIDEYQDTNMVQEAIVELISRRQPGNRFMVGDVKQSIYRFRLAEPGLFLGKYKTFRRHDAVEDEREHGDVREREDVRERGDDRERGTLADGRESAARTDGREYGADADEQVRGMADKARRNGDGEASGCRIDLARNFRSRRQIVDGVNFIFKQTMNEAVAEIAYDEGAELIYGADYPDPPASAGQHDLSVELMLIDRSSYDAYSGDEAADIPSGADTETGEAANPDGDILAGQGAEQELREMETAQLEARYVAMQIKRLMGEQGPPFPVYDKKAGGFRPLAFRDIVILLRATQQWAPVFIEELRMAGIPAYADLNTGYFTATEVEIVLSLLKIIDNPHQDIPLAAVLRSPIVGLSAEHLAQIRIHAGAASFYDAACRYAAMKEGGDEALQSKLRQFLERLETWRGEARQGALADLIWRVYRETGYYDLVGGLPGGVQRQANLRALYDRARQYESTSFRGLFRFLRFIERIRDSGGDMGTARALGEQEDVVRIMSIHKSKGLEFPVVFVAGLAKPFNRQDLNGNFLLHKQLGFGPKFVDTDLRIAYPTLPALAIRRRMRLEMLAEEMRVLYVALTRAKEKLYLIGTVKNMDKQLQTWGQQLDGGGWLLPDYVLAKARCYLDWIGPAIIRHPDAIGLRRRAGLPERTPAPMSGEPSRWNVSWMEQYAFAEAAAAAQEPAHSSTIEAIRHGEPVKTKESGFRDEIDRRLSWQYRHRQAETYLSKTSVSELKRLQRETAVRDMAGDEWPVPFLLAGQTPFRSPLVRRPRFMERQSLTAAERGTAFHAVMQHVPLSPELTEETIRETLRRLEERELLTAEQRESVDTALLFRFFAGELGKRLLRAERVYREVPFTYGLPAGEVYPDADDAARSETVLLQGVIDCLFEEKDGLVLLDYKTDAIYGNRLEQRVDAYRLQIRLYARAIEEIWRRPVTEKYLFFFDGAHVVKM